MHPVSKRKKNLACVSNAVDKVLSQQRIKKKRAVHQLPCLKFGSSSPYQRISNKNSITSVETCSNAVRLPKLSHHLRIGKPTAGEINLISNERKTLETSLGRSNKNAKDLMLICQKVEHVKQAQRNGASECKDELFPLRFTFPPFPARQEFVFHHHGLLGTNAGRGNSAAIKRKFVLTLSQHTS